MNNSITQKQSMVRKKESKEHLEHWPQAFYVMYERKKPSTSQRNSWSQQQQ